MKELYIFDLFTVAGLAKLFLYATIAQSILAFVLAFLLPFFILFTWAIRKASGDEEMLEDSEKFMFLLVRQFFINIVFVLGVAIILHLAT